MDFSVLCISLVEPNQLIYPISCAAQVQAPVQ
jgi:hypothetical protein